MSDAQLPLVCQTPNRRPREVTDEMVREAAQKIIKELVRIDPEFGDPDVVDDLLGVASFALHMDGYEIARQLEKQCYWDCDLRIANILDHFSHYCYELLRAAEKKWGEENPMDPPFPNGAMVMTPRGKGEIVEVDTFFPNSYLVRINDRKLIYPFEDVSAVEPASPDC